MIIDVHAHWGPWFFSMEVGSVGVNSELLDRFGIDIQLVSAIEAIVYDAPAGNRALSKKGSDVATLCKVGWLADNLDSGGKIDLSPPPASHRCGRHLNIRDGGERRRWPR